MVRSVEVGLNERDRMGSRGMSERVFEVVEGLQARQKLDERRR